MKKEIAEKYREILRRGNADEIAAFKAEYMPYRIHKTATPAEGTASTVDTILADYEKTDCSNLLIYGFEYGGNIYNFKLEKVSELKKYLTIEKDSKKNGANEKLRFKRLTNTEKVDLINKYNAKIICTKQQFDKKKSEWMFRSYGDTFERVIWEMFLQTPYKKSNKPYYLEPDIMVNDLQIQVKYERASLPNVETIKKAVEYINKKAD